MSRVCPSKSKILFSPIKEMSKEREDACGELGHFVEVCPNKPTPKTNKKACKDTPKTNKRLAGRHTGDPLACGEGPGLSTELPNRELSPCKGFLARGSNED